MVIGGSAKKLKRSEHDAKQLRSLEMIDLAVQKGESLTKKLLSFSRRPHDSAAGDRPHRGDRVAARRAGASVTGDIALAFDLPRQMIAVKVDPSELEIALLNLTLNARDAMPDGGRIAVSLRRVHSINGGLPPNLQGEFAAISVSDTGEGIPATIRERIFEPFFTTKAVDKGTGLGLSQVFGFVNQSQGAVTVQSEVGRGAHFTMFLPVSTEMPLVRAPATDAPAASLEHSRVLLVEDNTDVAAIAADYSSSAAAVSCAPTTPR